MPNGNSSIFPPLDRPKILFTFTFYAFVAHNRNGAREEEEEEEGNRKTELKASFPFRSISKCGSCVARKDVYI